MIMKTVIKLIAIAIGIFCGIAYYVISVGNTNSIYFDIDSQSVIKCNGKISNLNIISSDYKDDLRFRILPNKEGKSSFSFNELDCDYSIDATRTLINFQKFKLRPNMEYEITDISNGDCPPGTIKIRTDKNSFVVYADKTTCN